MDDKQAEYERLYEKYKAARDKLFTDYQSKLRFWPQTVEEATKTEDAEFEIINAAGKAITS